MSLTRFRRFPNSSVCYTLLLYSRIKEKSNCFHFMFSRVLIPTFFKRALSKASSPRVVSLRKEYPALFELALPLNPKSGIEVEVPYNQMLVWKCPNGADHEWSMPVSDMIKRLKSGSVHGTLPDGF